MASKGKEKVDEKGSSGKRKYEDSDKTGRTKRRNRGVLQFFEDAAYEVDEEEDSDDIDLDFDDDFLEEEFDTGVNVNSEPGKAPHLPFFPKEEELSEDELEKMLAERYKPGSSLVRYAEDRSETARAIDRNMIISSAHDPVIWKVKCMVGRERNSAFCLMQKFVDLRSRGTKLRIISAFAIDHVKGFIYIEADRQSDVNEACKGLCNIYSSRIAPVPNNDVTHLLSVGVRSKSDGISEGMWVRVKNGKYKGDLAHVVAVNHARKAATVKLVPRIDLQAMAEKFGGGAKVKRTAIPAPRLISSSELEEFRPLIQHRRDRDTGMLFEVFDGMMLKDGYLFKRVSIDSLSFWGVMPTEDELLKFEPPKKEESNNAEWLTQLYGERKKKPILKSDKGGGKGEGSSNLDMENNFEVHDLVFFGRKDFGVIIGTEKADIFRILKEGSEGPVVVNIELRQLKRASFDKKLIALDKNKKTIFVNDTVRIVEGPLEGKQGIVKHIYRGTIYLHDETEEENSGYFCTKVQSCEKVKLSSNASREKGDDAGPSGFEDFTSSPKSPLSSSKPWEEQGNNRGFKQDDAMFSIGQALRIKVGPLKGYLCRVMAVRRSDVTVKLDSQHKILTVKCEHLSEVRGKSSAISIGGDLDSKPFDLLGTQDGSGAWLDGATTSRDADRWGAGGVSAERSSWPAFPATGVSQPGSANDMETDSKKDSAWETNAAPNPNSSWGAAIANAGAVAKADQAGGWGKSEGWNTASSSKTSGSDGWSKLNPECGNGADTSAWGQKQNASTNQGAGWKTTEGSSASSGWGNNAGGNTIQGEGSSWTKSAGKNEGGNECWGGVKKGSEDTAAAWGKSSQPQDGGSLWGKQGGGSSNQGGGSSWGKQDGGSGKQDGGSSWGGKQDGGSHKQDGDGGSSWGKQDGGLGNQDGGSSWGSKQDGGSSWGSKQDGGSHKQDGGSSWGNQGGGSSWGKQDGGSGKQEGGSSWGGKQDGGSSWGKQDGGSGKQDGGSSWGKQEGGSSWGKQDVGSAKQDGGPSWGKQDGGASWSKQGKEDGGSSWGKQDGGASGGKQDGGSWQGDKNAANESKGWGDKDGSSERPFGDGRGSGGRRGRGGWRGGRDQQYGRGRSFGQDQSSGWSKENRDNYGSSGEKHDGWKPKGDGEGKVSSWNKGWNVNKDPSDSGDNKSNSYLPEIQDGDIKNGDNQSLGWQSGGGWNASKPSVGGDEQGSGWKSGSQPDSSNKSSGWGNLNASGEGQLSGWGKSFRSNDSAGGAGDSGGGWNKSKAPDEEKSSGWGQSNWGKSGTGNTGGDRVSSWGNKNSWNAGSSFGGADNNQFDSSGDGGRGGRGWRGGRGDGGGRSERGGFRGRGDRGGFRGRGGYDGRGRGRRDQTGNWRDRNDSGEDNKSYGWNKGSSSEAGGGWKSDNNSNSGEKGKFQSGGSGWNAPKEGGDAKVGGWNKGTGGGWNNQERDLKESNASGSWNNGSGEKGSGWNVPKDAESGGEAKVGGWNKGNGGGWNSQERDLKVPKESLSGWNIQAVGMEGGPSNVKLSGWGKGDDSGNVGNSGSSEKGSWNNGSGEKGSGWNVPKDAENGGEAKVGGWNKGNSGGWNSQERDSKVPKESSSGWNVQAVGTEGGPSNIKLSGWGKGDDSGNGGNSGAWNHSNAAGGGQSTGSKPEYAKGGEGGSAAGSWGKEAASSWSKGNDGGGKGGWS